MKKILVFLAFSGLLFAKPIVTTTILPTKFFIEQIAGDEISVNTMIEKGADPHTYEPKPSQMKNLEKSELYFSVGVEFDEIWLPKIAENFPDLKIIKTDDKIEKIAMSEHHHDEHMNEENCHDENAVKHHCETNEKHHHHGLDPHIWLDPVLVKTQVETIKFALINKFPDKKEIFEKNANEFLKKLDEFDKFAAVKLGALKNRNFIVYHPSWGYFAKRYSLNQIAIEIEGKEPKPAELEELIEEAKEENVRVIFVAPQFSKNSAKSIAKATNAAVIEIDQLPENWLSEMKKTVEIFAENL